MRALGIQERAHAEVALYGAFFEARAETAIVHTTQAFESFPLLVVPALCSADDALLARLVAYAEQGGHLLLTFRSGYADIFGRARWSKAPGPLRTAVGASYSEYANLLHPLPLQAEAGAAELTFTLPIEARAEAWADGLELEGATPLVSYVHPHFGRFPALVTQAVGKGRVTYVGTLPNAAFGKALASWTLAQAGLSPLGNHFPESIRLNRATTAQGQSLWFVSNWSWETHHIATPVSSALHVLTQQRADSTMTLEPWGVDLLLAD